jgi:pyrroline-5-carboxylate reductase
MAPTLLWIGLGNMGRVYLEYILQKEKTSRIKLMNTGHEQKPC